MKALSFHISSTGSVKGLAYPALSDLRPHGTAKRFQHNLIHFSVGGIWFLSIRQWVFEPKKPI